MGFITPRHKAHMPPPQLVIWFFTVIGSAGVRGCVKCCIVISGLAGGGVAYEGRLICSFRASNSLADEGILLQMGVVRIDSISKYGSIPVFRALPSVFI